MRKWLRELRVSNKMSQRNVAERLSITQQYYSCIESGQRQAGMSLDMAQKLSGIFDVPIDVILENENKERQSRKTG